MNPHSPESQTLEIRKYQNRRYYDITNSRHLCLQEIHQLILQGHNVRIVDAQSEQDITVKILTQILLDYEPLKLEVFSNELLTEAIRVNDNLLRDFVDLYFRQAFEAFCTSQRRFKTFLKEAHQLTSALTRPETWMDGLFPAWSRPLKGAPSQPNESQIEGETAENRKLRQDVEELREEIKAMKALLDQEKKPPAPHKQAKTKRGRKP